SAPACRSGRRTAARGRPGNRADGSSHAAPLRILFPSPPFRAEREGPSAERWEGEVGAGNRSGIPHLTPALSAPRGGEGVISALVRGAHQAVAAGFGARTPNRWQIATKRSARF